MNSYADLSHPLEIVRVMAEYGHFGAGADTTWEQQLFAAQCLCAAILIAEKYGVPKAEISVLKAWEREHRAASEEMMKIETKGGAK